MQAAMTRAGTNPSPDFATLVTDVVQDIVTHHPDAAVRQAILEDPIYMRMQPTAEERAAIAPPVSKSDIVLGIHHGRWDIAQQHHFIVLYQNGIGQGARGNALAMEQQVRETLLHEVDHHLGRNHTLGSVLVAATLLHTQGG
ncbi:hypothetical protein LCGC14_2752950 [marine sediment metagenome]|uniref:Uncharacterized protein n=1 Tax=marine sediment metagenome TaxID=412755 RepID=A0A0F9BSY0_9ZZZZ